MRTEEGRRTFVRSMMIGVPAFAGSATLLPAANATPAFGSFTGAVAIADGHIDGVLRRLARLHNEVAERTPTKADARRLAEEIRLLIGFRRDAGRDGLVTDAFRQIIEASGRDAVTKMEPDQARLRAGLVYYGIEPPALPIGTSTAETRILALDTLARHGVEQYYDDSAESLATWALVMADSPDQCRLFREMMTMFEAVAATMCLGAVVFPGLAPECFAASVVLTALKLMNIFLQC